MKTICRLLVLLLIVVLLIGCNEYKDNRVGLGEGVRSDDLFDNVLTRPVAQAFSALIGEGIELRDARLIRNGNGILELHVKLYNRSMNTKRFQYKVDWFDENGAIIPSKASVWQPASAVAKAPLAIRIVAPTPKATNYIMDTRKG